MKLRLIHPLWTHLPALGALAALVVALLVAGPLPASIPIHFGLSGAPDRYGSPWLSLGLAFGLSVFYMLLSVLIDELWARQERAKTFNWLAPFDEIVVGTLVGTNLGYLFLAGDGSFASGFPWRPVMLVTGCAALLSVVLELFRPFRAHPGRPAAADDKAWQSELARGLKGNAAFVYWDNQNPLYVTAMTVALPPAMIVLGVIMWFSGESWNSLLLIVMGVLSIIPYGGQRTVVTRREVVVRFGVLGIRVLRLKIRDVAAIDIHDFSPLRDFGGYGIRFNRQMKAYFLRGDRGVKLTAVSGKKYLVGSDHAERLAAVIRAVAEAG